MGLAGVMAMPSQFVFLEQSGRFFSAVDLSMARMSVLKVFTDEDSWKLPKCLNSKFPWLVWAKNENEWDVSPFINLPMYTDGGHTVFPHLLYELNWLKNRALDQSGMCVESRKWNYTHQIREYSTLCVEWQVNGRPTHSLNVPLHLNDFESKWSIYIHILQLALYIL